MTDGEPGRRGGLGLAACTAIVIGNMVGSGFYLSPSAVAPYGLFAVVMWMVMGVGAICLGLAFARLARVMPATGGPYAYTRQAYGDFAGFLIAWCYWISIWASLPVMALAFAGALVSFLPSLRSEAVVLGLTVGAIWFVALVNLRGVRTAGVFAAVTTYAKLVPFAAIAVIGVFFVDPAQLTEFNPSGQTLLASSIALAPLTMFAFLGLESATVPAGDVRDPHRTIPRATILGIAIAALLYVLGTLVVIGVVPREQLVGSITPFQDAASMMWGPWASYIVALGIMLSSIGALNGWTLLMGQVPMAAARDGLFPAAFARLSPRGVPAFGIVASTGLATMLLLLQASGAGFDTVYEMLVSLSTMAAVIPYSFCALAGALIAAGRYRIGPVEIVAFAFSVFTLYGCGASAVLYGTMLLSLGLPVFVWQRRRSITRPAAAR